MKKKLPEKQLDTIVGGKGSYLNYVQPCIYGGEHEFKLVQVEGVMKYRCAKCGCCFEDGPQEEFF